MGTWMIVKQVVVVLSPHDRQRKKATVSGHANIFQNHPPKWDQFVFVYILD
ncbi:hypothetical protein EDD64_109101 [Effusibacillus lacus]|nr:hypothetical protein EDD64_109101 [Effusibacillus lacus]